MDKIFSQRYAFCDFSSISGFPNPILDLYEWEGSLPRFRGEDWGVPTEHFLDFYDIIHCLHIVHKDV